jgi:hypothetical protein
LILQALSILKDLSILIVDKILKCELLTSTLTILSLKLHSCLLKLVLYGIFLFHTHFVSLSELVDSGDLALLVPGTLKIRLRELIVKGFGLLICVGILKGLNLLSQILYHLLKVSILRGNRLGFLVKLEVKVGLSILTKLILRG